MSQPFGPRRSRATTKPWPECPDVVVYRCGRCGASYQQLGCDAADRAPECCGMSLQRLEAVRQEDLAPGWAVDYEIVGGHNESAVRVFWNAERPEDAPEWVLLKTFTGSSLKYVAPAKRPPVVFALADEDAYVYCDEKRCLQCVFRCKRGFILYVYSRNRGLVEVPLERMSAHWQSASAFGRPDRGA